MRKPVFMGFPGMTIILTPRDALVTHFNSQRVFVVQSVNQCWGIVETRYDRSLEWDILEDICTGVTFPVHI
jgi:hypothetical protein